MEMWKFEDLVRGCHLFFTQLRHIVDSELDPYEGSLSPVNYEEPEERCGTYKELCSLATAVPWRTGLSLTMDSSLDTS
jgi:hypothetical protein